MTPHADPGPYDHRPVLHDLQYHLENGVPVLDSPAPERVT